MWGHTHSPELSSSLRLIPPPTVDHKADSGYSLRHKQPKEVRMLAIITIFMTVLRFRLNMS